MSNRINLDLPISFAKERRAKARQQLTGLLPGKIYMESSHAFISCRPVDVSSSGIGILTSTHLKLGDILVMEVKDKIIQMRIEWMKPDFGKRDLYRYGLKVESGSDDLVSLFKKSGCLV